MEHLFERSSDMRSKVQIFSLLFVAIFSLTLSHASDIPSPSVVPHATSELSPEDKLLGLAKDHFQEDKQCVLPAEEILLRAVATDKSVDFLQGPQNDVDPQIAAHWKEDRIIKADRLAWLCADGAASALVRSRDISISAARIDGALDLVRAKVRFPLHTWKCVFTGPIYLDNCSIRSLFLQHTYITNLKADGLTVE
jgi:hypothetical protein